MLHLFIHLLFFQALSGGLYPVSAVLGRQEVVGVIGYGQHGSTYGGNAIASAIGIEALKVRDIESFFFCAFFC